jgi:hypothetical protein
VRKSARAPPLLDPTGFRLGPFSLRLTGRFSSSGSLAMSSAEGMAGTLRTPLIFKNQTCGLFILRPAATAPAASQYLSLSVALHRV